MGNHRQGEVHAKSCALAWRHWGMPAHPADATARTGGLWRYDKLSHLPNCPGFPFLVRFRSGKQRGRKCPS